MTERRYALEFSAVAEKALRRLPRDVATRISKAADSLTIEPRPHGCKKLAGSDSEYRVRVGDYRIIYSVQDDKLIVLVIDLGHRKDIYR
jgi:mRNA interferase RelE/StbE